MSKSKEEYIMNVLRLGTLTFEGRNEVFKRARKQVLEGYFKNGNPILKYHWQCAQCQKWFRQEKELEVDHIEEVGPLIDSDWNKWIARCYSFPENGQLLCLSCHAKKTAIYAASRSFKRKPSANAEDDL